MPPPPVRVAVTLIGKPSAPHPPAELLIDKFAAVPVCNVIAPVVELIVGATPVMPWILASSWPTLSVTLSWLPMAPEATNVSVVPSTVMVSPATKFVTTESLGEAPDSSVAAVIGADGGPALFETAPPVTVASPNGTAGVPIGNGFWVKSAGFKPPAASSEPASAVVLAIVFGVVGRFAAY